MSKDESHGDAGLKTTTGHCWTDPPPCRECSLLEWIFSHRGGIVRMPMRTIALEYSRMIFIPLVLVPIRVILILHVMALAGFEEVVGCVGRVFKSSN